VERRGGPGSGIETSLNEQTLAVRERIMDRSIPCCLTPSALCCRHARASTVISRPPKPSRSILSGIVAWGGWGGKGKSGGTPRGSE
jgi:hypothetical protein